MSNNYAEAFRAIQFSEFGLILGGHREHSSLLQRTSLQWEIKISGELNVSAEAFSSTVMDIGMPKLVWGYDAKTRIKM